MKKLILTLIFAAIALIGYTQRMTAVYEVPDSTTAFGRVIAENTIIFNSGDLMTYRATATRLAVHTIADGSLEEINVFQDIAILGDVSFGPGQELDEALGDVGAGTNLGSLADDIDTVFTKTIISDTITTEYAYIKNKAHGFYAFEDSTVVVDCVQDTWVQVTNPAGNLFTEIQTNAGFIISGDTIFFNAPAKTGFLPHVLIKFELDGTAGNNKSFSFRIKNVSNVAGVVKKTTTKAGVNDELAISGLAYDRHAAFGDAYILEVMNNTDSTDFTANDGAIYIEVSHY